MRTRSSLVVANLVSVPLLVAALVAGWWEAAAFGSAVLALLDLLVLVRERSTNTHGEP